MAGSAHTCAHIIRWVPLCCYYTKAVLLVLKRQTCGALARKASTCHLPSKLISSPGYIPSVAHHRNEERQQTTTKTTPTPGSAG